VFNKTKQRYLIKAFLIQKAYLSKLGITASKPIHHNLSYEELYKYETDSLLISYKRGINTELGAVNVDTGRSACDKSFVVDDITENTIWWHGPEISGSGNRQMSKKTWDVLYDLSTQNLGNHDIYITDGYAGANDNTRMSVRVISEVA
jgi:phosphoenolpyruvate carboxykinase (ATP)